MKVFIVKAPCGEYEDYQEPIVKVFLDKAKAKKYVAEENAKLPLEQSNKCVECYFKWSCAGQKGKHHQTVILEINMDIVQIITNTEMYMNYLQKNTRWKIERKASEKAK